MNGDSTIGDIVATVIAETFAVPPDSISRATTADDIDGWDSLGHSILMTRLSTRLNVEIGEDVAASSRNVGELTDALARRLPTA